LVVGTDGLVIREYSLGKIVENAVTIVIALCILSRRLLLDRVRTAAVRTRHLVWPPLLREIFHTVPLVRRKTSLTLSLLTILRPVMNSTDKEVFTATDER